MKSSFKKLGQYIRLNSVRNSKLEITNLIGLSIQKKFIPSISNIIGTDMSTYRIINQNQFAYCSVTSRNGEKITVALYDEKETAIISQAYDVFEIIDKNELLPEYLMMWFRRPEFDRYARFKSHGSVREMFAWEELCEVELPVPSIATQRSIVQEYNVIQERIKLNQQLIEKLEATAQAIYQQWFVEFEFPNEDGKPYKSNGGEMIESELGDVPIGWKVGKLNDVAEVIDGDRGVNYPSIEEMSNTGYCLFLNAGNVSKTGLLFSENNFITKSKDEVLRKGKLKRNDIVLTTRGTVGNVGFYSTSVIYENIRINSGMVILRSKNEKNSIFIYTKLQSLEMKKNIENFLSGSAQPQLPIKDLIQIPIIIPNELILERYNKLILKVQLSIDNLKNQNMKLTDLKTLLLSRLSQQPKAEQ